MGVLEVILLLVGAVLAVLSFVIPAAKEGTSQETKTLAKEEIKTMVDKEMSGIRQHVDDVVDEAVGYAVEKTERSLERLTNEKIMAVNEYSDTVLQEIHKNHEEAMFLYDMLNAKHDNLKNTVSEVNKAVQEVQETISSIPVAEPVEAPAIMVKEGTDKEVVVKEPVVKEPEFPKLDLNMFPSQAKDTGNKSTSGKKSSKAESRKKKEEAVSSETIKEWDFLADVKEPGMNNNDQILHLHKQGKSTVAIAKELGLGVGEVKLVIDLYKNM